MSVFQLPKWTHPDFRIPGRKPVGPVEIDRATPLGKCCVFSFLGGNQALTHIGEYFGDEARTEVEKGERCAFISDNVFSAPTGWNTLDTFEPGTNTITVVIRANSVDSGGNPHMIVCKDVFNGDDGFRIAYDTTNLFVDGDRVSYGYKFFPIGVSPADGEWHTVIVEFDEANTTCRAWWDGNFLGSDTNIAITKYNFRLGVGMSSDYTSGRNFEGHIGDVHIFKGLHGDLLARNHNSFRSLFLKPVNSPVYLVQDAEPPAGNIAPLSHHHRFHNMAG